MSRREAYRIFMRHQLEFGVEEGFINNITVNDISGVIDELEDDPDFHERMARFLNDELEK